MKTPYNSFDSAAATMVDLLIDPDLDAAIGSAMALEELTHRLLIGIFAQVVAGAVARFATCHSMAYEDAVAMLMRIVRDTFAEANGLIADER